MKDRDEDMETLHHFCGLTWTRCTYICYLPVALLLSFLIYNRKYQMGLLNLQMLFSGTKKNVVE